MKYLTRFLGKKVQHPELMVSENRSDIAIIGLAGRYPMADTPNQFWENISSGIDCIIEIPEERWPHHQYFDPKIGVPGKTYSKWGGFIDGVETFDPSFFNISPREAAVQDPQERLFLQCAWEVLEDAGYTRKELNQQGAVGVFSGVQYQDYKFFSTDELQVAALPGSIANRVSWFCNFTGPSVSLDTMCSASLSAIHLACNSILQGDCYSAIAGGVNLTIHPIKYLLHAQGRFSSSHGRCMAFGQQGDGYVPAEGVGAVLLKSLPDAIADRDNIYAVIKGSAVNHGGYARGFTVPKASSQKTVISKAQDKAQIDLRAVNYIETHGTGTVLGDYVEFDGLTQAYCGERTELGTCALGSVKSNIGHCESAAGIAGLTKVLMQMKHRQWAPSLHSQQLNGNIDFSGSRFFIPQHSLPWENVVVENEGKVVRYPLTAALSGFGAGGSNAHLIIQEYESNGQNVLVFKSQASEPRISGEKSYAFPLSARTSAQLRDRVQALLTHLEQTSLSDEDLPQLEFTLCAGREAMEHRIAFIAGTMSEVKSCLKDFLSDRPSGWQGQVKATKSINAADQPTYCIEHSRESLESALSSWTKSDVLLDWGNYFSDLSVHRISLPTYPFARKRVWMPDSMFGLAVEQPVSSLQIHQEEAREDCILFSLSLTGQEAFLCDHRIQGRLVLPGVLYLEIIHRIVGMLDKPEIDAKLIINELKWLRPVVLQDEDSELKLILTLQCQQKKGQRRGSFWHFSATDAREQKKVFCEATLAVVSADETVPIVVRLPAEVQSSIVQHRDGGENLPAPLLSASRIYSLFTELGIEYGESHQRLDALYIHSSGILAKLRPAPAHEQASFTFIPGVLDSALQAMLGLMSFQDHDSPHSGQEPAVPFAVERVETHASHDAIRNMAWVWIQPRESSLQKMQQCDLLITDDQGQILLSFIGYRAKQGINTSGVSRQVVTSLPQPQESAVSCTLYSPEWQPYDAVHAAAGQTAIQRWVIFGAAEHQLYHAIAGLLQQTAALSLLDVGQIATPLRYQGYLEQVIVQLQKRLSSRQQCVIQIVTCPNFDRYVLDGLYPFLRAVQAEHSQIRVQLIQLSGDESPESVNERLEMHAGHLSTMNLAYHSASVMQRVFRPLAKETSAFPPWKNGATYLLSGGSGALGKLFVSEIIRQAPDAHIALLMRRPADPAFQAWLSTLPNAGKQVSLHEVALNDLVAVKTVVTRISHMHPDIRGVLHIAGILDDQRFSALSSDSVKHVLAPKVSGTVNLDLATRHLPLDFMAFFSSVSGVFGNAGQSNYAAANGFMDAYAHYRQSLQEDDQCSGVTLSVNWPLWENGGMQISEALVQKMQTRTGLYPLPTDAGLRAFYQALNSGRVQVMVLFGERATIESTLPDLGANHGPDASVETESMAGKPETDSALPDLETLKQMTATLLGIDLQHIDAEDDFEMMGFDSVTLNELIVLLKNDFGVGIELMELYKVSHLSGLYHFIHQSQEAWPAPIKSDVVPSEPMIDEQTTDKPALDIYDLKMIAAELLQVDVSDVDVSADFEMLGFDSISLNEFISELKHRYAVVLELSDVYDYRTLDYLYQALLQMLTEETPGDHPEHGISKLFVRVSALLGVSVEELDREADFDLLGFDSITLSELSGFISQDYGVEISLGRLYECSGLNHLYALIESLCEERETPDITNDIHSANISFRNPLSAIQQVMLAQIESQPRGAGVYQPILIYHIDDDTLHTEKLRAALSVVISYYGILTSDFAQGYQIHRPVNENLWPLDSYDLRSMTAEQQQHHLMSMIRESWHQSTQDAHLRSTITTSLYQLNESRWALLFVTHHCVLDGWSFIQFIHQLEVVYEQLKVGLKAQLPVYQDKFAQRVELEKQAEEQVRLSEIRQQLLLGHAPLGWMPQYQTAEYGYDLIQSERCVLDHAQVIQLKEWGRKSGLPLKATFLNALYQMIGRYMQREHVTVELVCNGRTPHIANVNEQIGLYWSWVPVTCQLNSQGMPVPTVLRKQILLAEESALYPYHTQGMKTDEIAFNFVQFPVGSGEQSKFRLDRMYDRFHHPLKLLVAIDGHDGCATLSMDFDSRYFDSSTRHRLLQDYRTLLLQYIASEHQIVLEEEVV